jgi:MoxR-like ATPase
MKLVVRYPDCAEERSIPDAMATGEPTLSVQPVVGVERMVEARHVVNRIYVHDRVKDYIVANALRKLGLPAYHGKLTASIEP